jgi:hypothetical protein
MGFPLVLKYNPCCPALCYYPPLELADRDRLSQQALEESKKTRLATEEALSLSEQSNRQLREKLMALGIDPDSL